MAETFSLLLSLHSFFLFPSLMSAPTGNLVAVERTPPKTLQNSLSRRGALACPPILILPSRVVGAHLVERVRDVGVHPLLGRDAGEDEAKSPHLANYLKKATGAVFFRDFSGAVGGGYPFLGRGGIFEGKGNGERYGPPLAVPIGRRTSFAPESKS